MSAVCLGVTHPVYYSYGPIVLTLFEQDVSSATNPDTWNRMYSSPALKNIRIRKRFEPQNSSVFISWHVQNVLQFDDQQLNHIDGIYGTAKQLHKKFMGCNYYLSMVNLSGSLAKPSLK